MSKTRPEDTEKANVVKSVLLLLSKICFTVTKLVNKVKSVLFGCQGLALRPQNRKMRSQSVKNFNALPSGRGTVR